ncbi:MAG: UbiA family prenyltransferase, partial [Verrucomicrobiales bacterium]|nr:UbiA family prenyltransferase [Verrucomicrobiales bacterium]
MIKAMLELGRVSNLPTVVTNCLAAWVVMSGGSAEIGAVLWWLCGGACLMYVGGTALNDAFDVGFDREHRKERPIPSGRVTEKGVWAGGGLAMAAGAALMIFMGGSDPAYVLALAGAVIFYDYIHKRSWVGPWVMGLCRFLLFVAVASAIGDGSRFVAVMTVAGMVGLYVVGLTFAAKGESGGGRVNQWGAILVFVPALLLAFRL